MRILDENNIELTEEEVNLELGYLKPESIISIHYEAIEEVKERINKKQFKNSKFS